jgi:uncharacterized protein (TIGR00730 family)
MLNEKTNASTKVKVTSVPVLDLEIEKRAEKINKEFVKAFNFIKNTKKSVTVFGSARSKPTNQHYKEARSLCKRIASELGYAVVTGGGPGIMEAANRGAAEGGGASVGFNIKLPYEQIKNKYVSDSLDFYYFFSRKVALSFSAEAYVYFPGGFGTLDEFFEIMTLIQTKKIPQVPVILMGSDFWQPLNTFIKKHLYNSHKNIDLADMSLYTITDNEDEIIEIIRKAPMRKE